MCRLAVGGWKEVRMEGLSLLHWIWDADFIHLLSDGGFYLFIIFIWRNTYFTFELHGAVISRALDVPVCLRGLLKYQRKNEMNPGCVISKPDWFNTIYMYEIPSGTATAPELIRRCHVCVRSPARFRCIPAGLSWTVSMSCLQTNFIMDLDAITHLHWMAGCVATGSMGTLCIVLSWRIFSGFRDRGVY